MCVTIAACCCCRCCCFRCFYCYFYTSVEMLQLLLLFNDDELTIDIDVKWKCCVTKTIKRITISFTFPHTLTYALEWFKNEIEISANRLSRAKLPCSTSFCFLFRTPHLQEKAKVLSTPRMVWKFTIAFGFEWCHTWHYFEIVKRRPDLMLWNRISMDGQFKLFNC